MIGGFGKDVLIGNANDDILIGGVTTYDNNPAALTQIPNVWKAAASYQQGVAALQSSSLRSAWYRTRRCSTTGRWTS
jgi:hypothetical protein